MSAIQKADKLLTIKTDSKQIDISIFKVESTYSRGNEMLENMIKNLESMCCSLGSLLAKRFAEHLVEQNSKLADTEVL